jgi:thiol-disulfide isomerase/thioredoxin
MVKENLESQLNSKSRAFVLFYASWCPFSQSFLPIFQEYAKSNPKECMSVMIDDSADICDKYSIEYYPTVIVFKKGKIQKRLDAIPGVGIEKKHFKEFCK